MKHTKIPQNPTIPPENPPDHRHISSPTENHPQNSSITHKSDQTVESVFSRLSLYQNFSPQTETPPPCLRPPPFYSPVLSDFEEKQQASIWAHTQRNNGGVNGLFGPHQNINVGPAEVGAFYEEDPGLHSPLNMMGYQEFSVAACTDYDYCSSLHDTKTLSSDYFPILPSSQRNSVYVSFHQLQQQQILQKMGILNFKLDKGMSEEEIEMLLPEVMEALCDFMTHKSGSQISLKLFLVCNKDQRSRIIMALSKIPVKLISICLNSYGSSAMLKMLEKLTAPKLIWLQVVSALSYGAVVLATDSNGQHVIHYCIKQFPCELTKNLVDAISDNCIKVGTTKNGCCVIQSCVEFHGGKARERLITVIIANALHLAKDPYGNYVVQHLIGMKMPVVTANLLKRFLGCFVYLSCNKYASNVVEKFLVESGGYQSAQIIMELLTSPKASILLMDPYGNFVIQSALLTSKGRVLDALVDLIRVYSVPMQYNPYGRKILALFQRGGISLIR